MLRKLILSAALCAGFATAQTSVPLFVQPPQSQTPAQPVAQPMAQPVAQTPPAAPASSAGVTFTSPAPLQETRTLAVTPASQRPMLWGSFGSEAYILPSLSLAFSAPVGQVSGMDLALRGTAGAVIIPLLDFGGPVGLFGADALFSRPGDGLRGYGGPSVGVVQPGAGVYWAGGVLGVRAPFGTSPHLGYAFETKVRYLFGHDTGLLTSGINLGLTYRF